MQSTPKLARLGILLAMTFGACSAALADEREAEERARRHISSFRGQSLQADGHTFEKSDVQLSPEGSEHVRFERRIRGQRVIGGDMVVHTDARGIFQGVTQTLKRQVNVASRANVSVADAQRAALKQNPGLAIASTPELVVYARGDLPLLAYDVLLQGMDAEGTPVEKHVIVNASNGRVIDAWNDIHTAPAPATGRGFFSGTVGVTANSLNGGFELRDPSRGNQNTLNMGNVQSGKGKAFSDADNVWGNFQLTDLASIGIDAHYGTAMTWDYFLKVHGRAGIANDGVGSTTRVHYGKKYNNAFWSDGCLCMTYGDGDGVTFNPFSSLDVAGHEMAHGLTSRTAKLIYSGESGGLNEATSDIFGTAVEFYAKNPNDPGDYLIGEKIYKRAGRALRTMIQPSADGGSADCWYADVGNLDVHLSSGVANHFFYLLAEGSAPNAFAPNGSKTCATGNTRVASGGPVVTGITRAKAEKIWYRALTRYMTSNTNFAGARVATIKAAEELYGLASAESVAVGSAWSAVLVN